MDTKESAGPSLSSNIGIIRKAIALAYSAENDNAPRVAAQALGELAEIMVELAVQNGVPVVSNHALAEFLTQLKLGELIPVHVYEAVALIYKELSLYPR